MNTDLGMIYMFSGNFAPVNYASCDGQLLAISSNAALFSLVGTYYGGNGTTNFQLPDLQGRVPLHFGQGAGLSGYQLGEAGGAEQVTLLSNQMPQHSHALFVNSSTGTTASPGNTTYLAAGPATGSGPNASLLKSFTTDNTPANIVPLNPGTIQMQGGYQPHNNIQPFLAVNFIIALAGTYPTRN